MAVVAWAGAKLWIGPQVTESTDIESEYIALTPWTLIGMVETTGDVGDESEEINFTALETSRVFKAKGPRNAGTMPLTVGHIPTDAGQLALIAAEATNKNYGFKMELPDAPTSAFTNTFFYFKGLVMSKRMTGGGASDIMRRVFQVGINSEIFEIEPDEV